MAVLGIVRETATALAAWVGGVGLGIAAALTMADVGVPGLAAFGSLVTVACLYLAWQQVAPAFVTGMVTGTAVTVPLLLLVLEAGPVD